MIGGLKKVEFAECIVLFNVAGRVRFGKVRRGWVRSGQAGRVRFGMVRRGWVRSGQAGRE